jgi:hypothetical protein
VSSQPISTCSQDSEASRSPRKPPASKRSPCAKKSRGASGSSEKHGGSRSTPTSQSSTGDDTGAFPFLLADHPANQPAEPGNNSARRMTAGSGEKLFAFLPNHGRIALFSRTLLGSSIWRSTEYLLRWQVMGVPTGNLGDLFTRSGRAVIDAILEEIRAHCYEVQPVIVPACALDSPQLRERLWLVGFMADTHERRRSQSDGALCPRRDAAQYAREFMARATGPGREGANAIGERDEQLTSRGSEVCRA